MQPLKWFDISGKLTLMLILKFEPGYSKVESIFAVIIIIIFHLVAIGIGSYKIGRGTLVPT